MSLAARKLYFQQRLKIVDNNDKWKFASKPSFWIRLLAVIIDGFIFGIAWSIYNKIYSVFLVNIGIQFYSLNDAHSFLEIIVSLFISLCAHFAFFGWFYKNKGGSPGKLLFGLKVVNMATGENLNYFQTFKREIIGKTFSGFLFIGYIIAAFREDGRTLHDFFAGSKVIENGQSNGG